MRSYENSSVFGALTAQAQLAAQSAASAVWSAAFLISVAFWCSLFFPNKVLAAVAFQAAGTPVSGTGNVTVAWPAHAINDIALLFIESTGGQAASLGTPAGFAAVANSPQSTGTGTGGTRLTVYWARATTTTMTSPVVTDPGDHVYARILTYRGVVTTGNPWNVTGGGNNTFFALDSITTTVANTRLVQIASRDNDSSSTSNFSAQTNSNLTGIAERSEAGTTSGNGGGFALWDGVKATVGAIGSSTFNSVASISSAYMSLAIRPQGATAPTYQGVGLAIGGTGSVTVAWPTHAINDIALLVVESAGGEPVALSSPNGFVAVGNSPQFTGTGTNGTRLTVFWARATSTAMLSPVVADAGNHVVANIITYRGGVATGNPFDVTGGGAFAKPSISGVTTTVANTLVVQAASRDNDSTVANFSAQTNANLTSITERSDAGTTSGNGGGFAVWDGGMTTAGATGNTTVSSTSNILSTYLTIALAPVLPALHHIRIEHDGSASNCTAEPITIKACANAACTAPHYTTTDVTAITLAATGTVTWSPVNPQTITAASGGINSSITLARASAGTATLSGPAATGTTPNAAAAYECYNTATNTAGDCSLVYSDSLSFDVPNQTAGTRQAVSMTVCASSFASTTRTVKFWSSYVNPATGTLAGKVVAGTGNADCATGYVALGTAAGAPTSLNLAFGAGTTPQATFSLCYPDAGQVRLDAQYDGAAGNTPPDAGVQKLGNDSFIAKPDHFTVSAIKCTSTSAANCAPGAIAMATPGDNPGAADAAGDSFMRAGDSTQTAARFTATVTAKNALNASTPNFGREIVPEGIKLTQVLIAPAGGDPGVLTCKGSTTACAVPGGPANFTSGATTITDLAWDDVGIIQLMPTLSDADYLGTGEVSTPMASGNIGRFIADHFNLSTDPDSPILSRADLVQATAGATGTTAPSTVIDVNDSTGFAVNSKVRIPGAGAAGAAFTATVTAVSPLTLTLDAAIGTPLDGSETVFSEWGTYMGELFNAQFKLTAVNLANNTTLNYEGIFAKLSPVTVGALGFGVVNGATNLTARLDSSMAPSGSFALGVADVSAPLSISRGTSADGPYAALKVGIAPVDTDGVKMLQPYDLNVGGALDHTSIMDPLVQNVTEVRYGRIKIPNAYGSARLPRPITATVQYFNGTYWQTSVMDNESSLGSILQSDVGALTHCPFASIGATSIAFGVGTISLPAPGVACSANITANGPMYLPSTTGRVTFGIYKSPLIYRRENY